MSPNKQTAFGPFFCACTIFRFSCKVSRFSKKDYERAVTQRHLVSLEGQASANALVKTLTKTGETS
jgi:hypothetical protein